MMLVQSLELINIQQKTDNSIIDEVWADSLGLGLNYCV